MSVVAEFANTELADVAPGRIGNEATPTMLTPAATVGLAEGIAVTSATAYALNEVTNDLAAAG
ncbi:linaridin family RiPP [Streptomyces sp. HC44]|uniref:Linaridin family RiPP n=1 Tax=Streptomyces scabichelini TaxID=2711217 RepID=A0A6G4V851_9ACTN|nr:linaridin family RiPP [Streptomyces scabichelini]NGO10249.1 linaridin family RiPP [Streptomyces scabichelini]